MIFVVVGLGWAVYLLPRLLRREPERAEVTMTLSSNPRVIGRAGAVQRSTLTKAASSAHSGAGAGDNASPSSPTAPAAAATASTSSTPAAPPAQPVASTPTVPVAAEQASPAKARSVSRRQRPGQVSAAQRRRRVLGGLLLVVLALIGTSAAGVTAWWSVAVPTGLICGFLLIARRSVVRASRAAAHPGQARPAASGSREAATISRSDVDETTTGIAYAQLGAALAAEPAAQTSSEVTDVDTAAEPASVSATADGEPAGLSDDSLWDPIPITIPTYVKKVRAQRTVRTIELTGITSSGHDAEDSKLVREVETRPQNGASPAAAAGEETLPAAKVAGA